MGEFLSPAGRKRDDFAEDPPPQLAGDHSADADDRTAERQMTARLDETFLEGDGITAAIGRIKKLEVALAGQLQHEINQTNISPLQFRNRLTEWASIIEAMRKVEKDAPGILSSNDKTIDIAEVEEGVTKLLITIVNRLAQLPLRAMSTLAGFTDPHEIREELEKEIALAYEPIMELAWIPPEFKAHIASLIASATDAVEKRAAAAAASEE